MFGSKLRVKAFEDTILQYEAMPVETGRILFYGHSLFTRCSNRQINRWGNPVLEEEIRKKDGSPAVLNHGFGTSSADDLLYYYHRMVKPYKPSALVLATGNNDFIYGYSPVEVMEILGRIVDYTQADFPGIPIYIIACMHSLKRKGEISAFTRQRDEFNRILKIYCQQKPGCRYFCMADHPFMYDDPKDAGQYDRIREDIYVEDQVHFNPEGYRLFMGFVRDMLEDIL